MFRTMVTALGLLLLVSGVPAAAAGHDAAVPASVVGLAATIAAAPLAIDVDQALPSVRTPRLGRGSMLPALYVSLSALNALDAHATTTGVRRGAVEANPLMRGVAGNPAATWAVKGGVTAATIVVAERLWRQNRRASAVAVMIVSNGLMAAVAARNASVLQQTRR